MLKPHQRQRLMAAGQRLIDLRRENAPEFRIQAAKGDLDVLVCELQGENPAAFHTEATLQDRFFFDEPMRFDGEAEPMPMRGFVRSLRRRAAWVGVSAAQAVVALSGEAA